MLHTSNGVVLIDTTARPIDIQTCLMLEKVSPDDICLILLTHSHSDHTSGVPLFKCPILAHKLTLQRISKRGTERAKAQMPTGSFEKRRSLEIGGVKIEMIHLGGHTPDSTVMWLPDNQILFAGDLIFQGRYPFLATADVEKLMKVLQWIPSLSARIIVPGHGVLCDNEEVLKQLNYLEATWERTEMHMMQGHTLEEMLIDSNYPCYSSLGYEKLHPWNIKVTYQQLRKKFENEG
jgi:cyclase